MRWKIGVFGSNQEELDPNTIDIAKQLGRELARWNIILITGGSSGIPYIVASEAAKRGTDVWGYSPFRDIRIQKKLVPNEDVSIYKKLIFVSKDFPFAPNIEVSKKYRNVISTANCDAGIIISGRWGTLNEFTNLYDMGKVIGVLTGTGGVADELPVLTKRIRKKSKARIVFNNNPKELISKIIDVSTPGVNLP